MEQKEIMQELLNLINKVYGTDIEMHEEFEVIHGTTAKYRINNIGLILIDSGGIVSGLTVNTLFNKNTTIKRLPFKPRINETYYVPDIYSPLKYDAFKYIESKEDAIYFKRGLICKTSSQAIKLCDKILNSIK